MSRTPRSIVSLLVGALLLPAPASAQANSVLTLIPTDGRQLELGAEVTGALSTSDYASVDDYLLEVWELEGQAGQSVTIDLMSDVFDARLYVAGPGFAETLSDDDGGGGCNSRLTVTFLETGTYRVAASSFAGETGTYTLRVTDRPEPAPGYGCGDVNPDVLAGLPTDDRILELGSVASGVLGPAAAVVQDGRLGQAWRLTGAAGQRISVILESDDFDAYLYLTGPGLGEILTDDDGAGDLNSLIDVTLPTDGPYMVVASALSAGEFGSYTLRVEEAADLNELALTGTIDLGQTVEGALLFDDPTLLEGRRGQVWGFEGASGQRVAIDLMSDVYDTYLYLVGPGLTEPISNDDGGDGTNSQITTTLSGTGTYRILVSSYSSGSTGAFTLTLSPR